jgi:molecular chaperone DnaJ
VSLRVTIPAGVESGMRLRLAGEGEGGTRGGPTGDLYVAIAVEPHQLFERDGADLHLELPVSVFQAILGDRLKVPGILGEDREVDIPTGSQPGDQSTVRGAGMPTVGSGRRGNLVVHLRVVVPRRLTAEQRRLIDEAAKLGGSSEEEPPGGGLFERLKKAFAGEG